MKSLLLMLVLCISGSAFAQDIRVQQSIPPAVEKNFKKKFPAAKDVEWHRQGDRVLADFDVNRVDHKALYEANGKLLAWKYDVRSGALPAPVTRAIRTQYKGFKVDDAEMITRGKEIFYQVELDGKPDDLKVVFDKEGKVIENADWW